jgi:hypothetical protein
MISERIRSSGKKLAVAILDASTRYSLTRPGAKLTLRGIFDNR